MANKCDLASKRVSQYPEVKSVTAWWDNQPDTRSTVTVSISSLQCSDSPRLGGENADHLCVLAESEAVFPPIIVHRPTMRVIDGMHRLRATMLRGKDKIAVRFFEGEEKDAFLLAVEANIKHGLPLSLADRTAAATRILSTHPQLSDRAIASSTGLAANTVGAIRRRSTAHNSQLNRVGRDGRIRPLTADEGRRIAAELIACRPSASLREISNAAGISLGTAQKVRKRLCSGEDSMTREHNGYEKQKGQLSPEDLVSRRVRTTDLTPAENRPMILQILCKDPSLRFSNPGRTLIHLLNPLALDPNEWERLIHKLPPHCANAVANAARVCAQVWQEVAVRLADRAATTTMDESS